MHVLHKCLVNAYLPDPLALGLPSGKYGTRPPPPRADATLRPKAYKLCAEELYAYPMYAPLPYCYTYIKVSERQSSAKRRAAIAEPSTAEGAQQREALEPAGNIRKTDNKGGLTMLNTVSQHLTKIFAPVQDNWSRFLYPPSVQIVDLYLLPCATSYFAAPLAQRASREMY